MDINHRQRMIDDLSAEFSNNKGCYFLTLNALTKDDIKLSRDVTELIHRLNYYCFGRSYKRNVNRLKSVGVSEVGTVNQGLHMHLAIIFANETGRSVEDIERFIRKKWSSIIRQKKNLVRNSNLVDLRLIDDLQSCFGYMTKTFHHHPNQFNFQYF